MKKVKFCESRFEVDGVVLRCALFEGHDGYHIGVIRWSSD